MQLAPRSRIHYILAVALFLAFAAIVVSGIIISRTFRTYQALGPDMYAYSFWTKVHFAASDVTIALVGLHLVLHWEWIARTVKRHLFRRDPSIRKRPAAPPEPATANPCISRP